MYISPHIMDTVTDDIFCPVVQLSTYSIHNLYVIYIQFVPLLNLIFYDIKTA